METSLNLCGVAFRFVKYTDGLHRYAIFEIGRIATPELEALGKAYTPILHRLVGDPTNGTLQKKSHSDSFFYTARICLFVGDICDGKDLIEKESDRAIVTITYTSFNMRPTLKAIKHCGFDRDETWFKRFPVNWDDYEYASSTDTAASEVKEEAVMETSFDLTAVAIRFVKYVDFTDSLRRYAIFEIGRVGGNIELKALEKAYTSQLCQIPGDLTNGILQQKQVHHNSGCYTVRLCLFVGNILDGADLIEKGSDATKVTITYATGNIRPSLKSIKRMTAYGRPWFERFSIDWDNHEDTPSTDTTKTSEVKEEKEMNSEKIEFSENPPKKWVSLYCDLHELFSSWCQKRGATLEESVFSSSYLGYPVGIVFRISRKFSSDSKDELKFTVIYDTTFKTVAIRFFADNIESFNVTTPKERLQIRRITFCQPIFKSFIGDKPSEHQIYGSQTNGDPESKTSADWKPVDVIREYFGTDFLDKIGEIFGKYIPTKDCKDCYHKLAASILENHEDTPSTDTAKTSEADGNDAMKISERIKFPESAQKKWVDLYTLLYDHFAHYCHRVDATLHQRTFACSNRSWYPAGIDFYIMKRNSSDGKDKFKFSVFYDELTKQVTLRFFASNVDIVIGGDHIHESSYCEPIISVFLFDKPRVEVKSFDITNGDTDNKMEHDWRPLDILQTYFGDMFWDKLVEIFSGFIPKQTEIFYENILKSWNSDPKYQFFNYIQEQFSKFTKEWFHGTVKKIVKSVNAIDWEVVVIDFNPLTGYNSSRKYRFELRHRIDVKDINDISDDNLTVFKIDPSCGVEHVTPDKLDDEFGSGFQSHVELIYNCVRAKINEFVKEEKKMTNDEKKELDVFGEALKRIAETLTTETPVSKPDDPRFPHFSTSKDGVKLVTIPWDVYRTMTNTQYGMTTTIVKDRASTIMNAYWNPKTGAATIIWADGSKTMSKPMKGTTPDPEIGFAICIAKKMMGPSQNKWRKWLKSVVDASAETSKKKSDKSRIKLEKQARARLDAQQITEPSDVQLTEMIETIVKENATRNRPNVSVKFIDHSYDALDKPAPKKRPGRKKKTTN